MRPRQGCFCGFVDCSVSCIYYYHILSVMLYHNECVIKRFDCVWKWAYMELLNIAWWRHQMETVSALLAICAGNSPVPVNSPHKGQWRGASMFSLICVWINGWVNNREANDLRRYRAHYDVIVISSICLPWGNVNKIWMKILHIIIRIIKEMHSKTSSAKCWTFCWSRNVSNTLKRG